MNPWDAVGSFFVGLIESHKKYQLINKWLALIFSMLVSSVVAFLFVGGTTIGATKSLVLGIGAGMVAAAIVLTIFVRVSPLTKGMMFVFPGKEAGAEINSDVQILNK